jgi:hypothetical protein
MRKLFSSVVKKGTRLASIALLGSVLGTCSSLTFEREREVNSKFGKIDVGWENKIIKYGLTTSFLGYGFSAELEYRIGSMGEEQTYEFRADLRQTAQPEGIAKLIIRDGMDVDIPEFYRAKVLDEATMWNYVMRDGHGRASIYLKNGNIMHQQTEILRMPSPEINNDRLLVEMYERGGNKRFEHTPSGNMPLERTIPVFYAPLFFASVANYFINDNKGKKINGIFKFTLFAPMHFDAVCEITDVYVEKNGDRLSYGFELDEKGWLKRRFRVSVGEDGTSLKAKHFTAKHENGSLKHLHAKSIRVGSGSKKVSMGFEMFRKN